MKKLLAIISSMVLLVSLAGCLSGCEKEQKPLRVLVDLGGIEGAGSGFSPVSNEGVAISLKEYIIANGGPEDIEMETLPAEGSERSIALTRLRTEMMAGRGPDLFLVAFSWDIGGKNVSLFLQPEKSKELGLFYPLDDYIENAQFMEWDNLNQTIMQAGYSEEWGQVLLPLAYNFPITLFDPDEITHTPSKDYTWYDQMADETLREAASTLWVNMGSEPLGDIADYVNKKLLITEEELLEIGKRYAENVVRYGDKMYEYTHTRMTVNYDDLGELSHSPAIVPLYSINGGVSATITAFGAINATSKRPDDAFFILDLILSKQSQQTSAFYHFLLVNAGLPVYDGLMTREASIKLDNFENWYMKDDVYETFCAMQDSITEARLYGSMEFLVENLYKDFVGITEGYAEGSMEELAHQTYTRMRQELSE